MTLGTYIKASRERAGLTQAQVSKRMGWRSAQFVSNLECGNAGVPPERLANLARVIKAAPERILDLHIVKYRQDFMKRAKIGKSK